MGVAVVGFVLFDGLAFIVVQGSVAAEPALVGVVFFYEDGFNAAVLSDAEGFAGFDEGFALEVAAEAVGVAEAYGDARGVGWVWVGLGGELEGVQGLLFVLPGKGVVVKVAGGVL